MSASAKSIKRMAQQKAAAERLWPTVYIRGRRVTGKEHQIIFVDSLREFLGLEPIPRCFRGET